MSWYYVRKSFSGSIFIGSFGLLQSCSIEKPEINKFRAIDYSKCMYHSEEVVYYYGAVHGRYLWWSQQAHKFNSEWAYKSHGWKSSDHRIDVSHYFVKQKDYERFMRNLCYIVEEDGDRIKYEMIIQDALNTYKNAKIEYINDAIDIDPVFTPETSEFMKLKEQRTIVPQLNFK